MRQAPSKRRLNWKRLAVCAVVAIVAAIISQFQADPVEWWAALGVGFLVAAVPMPASRGINLDWFVADRDEQVQRGNRG